MKGRWSAGVFAGACWLSGLAAWGASAPTVDVEALRQPWRNERARVVEVGRHPVRWRHAIRRREGLKAGVRFTAPLPRRDVWTLATDYRAIGRMTPGVSDVQVTPAGPQRQRVAVEVRVLWKQLRMVLDVEHDPPQQVRFLWRHPQIGALQGLCTFDASQPLETDATLVECSSWFQPSRQAPLGLLAAVERAALLHAVHQFLSACDARQRRDTGKVHS